MATMDKVFAAYNSRLATLQTSTNPYARGIAWVEGTLVPLHEARIPMMDQGFLHSDLTYDVPAIWDGRFFRLDDHLTRLQASCKKMRLTLPLPAEEVKGVLVEMARRSGIRDAFVELIVTRGLKGVRGTNRDTVWRNNLYMFVQPYVWVMEPEVQRTGGRAVVARTVRRTPPGAMDPTVKNLQWGDLTRGLFEASDRGAEYPFLTDGDGGLTEGSGYNICLIKDGVVFTPQRGVLEGVTRRSMMDVAREMGVEVRVEYVPVEMCYECDEMFMCTTAGGIMPITMLDGQPANGGKLGPITQEIWDRYWKMHYDEEKSFAIDYDSELKMNGNLNGYTNGHANGHTNGVTA